MAKNLIKHPTSEELRVMSDDALIMYCDELIAQYGDPKTKNGPAARLTAELIRRLKDRRHEPSAFEQAWQRP